MNLGQIITLISAVTALVTALGTMFAQIGHQQWHKQQTQQPQGILPDSPGGKGKS